MRRVSPQEAHDLMVREGYVYLDVRTVPEFESSHPAGAYNVPFLVPDAQGLRPNPDFVAQVLAALSYERALIVGCASGVRSLSAAVQLAQAGFVDLFEQRAGMTGTRDPFGRIQERGWSAEGLPVSARAEPGRSYSEIARVDTRASTKAENS